MGSPQYRLWRKGEQVRAATTLSGWGYGHDTWGWERGNEGQAGPVQHTGPTGSVRKQALLPRGGAASGYGTQPLLGKPVSMDVLDMPHPKYSKVRNASISNRLSRGKNCLLQTGVLIYPSPHTPVIRC